MTQISRMAHIASLSAMGALAIGYTLAGVLIGAPWIAGCWLLGLIGRQRGWDWSAPLGSIGFVSAAAFGVWRGAPAAWMLFATVSALVAWDLDVFAQRMRRAKRVAGEAELIQSHLRRVSIAGGLGLALGGLAVSVRVEFSFGWALLLGLLALLGLSRAIGFLRRESD